MCRALGHQWGASPDYSKHKQSILLASNDTEPTVSARPSGPYVIHSLSPRPTPTPTPTCRYSPARPPARPHARTHQHTHTYTHTHTHTHTPGGDLHEAKYTAAREAEGIGSDCSETEGGSVPVVPKMASAQNGECLGLAGPPTLESVTPVSTTPPLPCLNRHSFHRGFLKQLLRCTGEMTLDC